MIRIIESSCFSQAKSSNEVNEDCMLTPKVISDGVLFAVADGVGSYKGADLASLTAIKCLDNINSNKSLLDYDSVFNEILKAVQEISNNDSQYEKASTTLTYCFVSDRGIDIGHIGDCRAYIKKGKKLLQITKDNTQHQYYLDQNIFKKSQLKNVKGKNIITTAISRVVPMEYSHYHIPLDDIELENDSFSIYLMSDGAHSFWEKSPRFSDNTMNSVVNTGASLLRRINRSGPVDDYTFIGCKLILKSS